MELCDLTIHELASLYRKGEASPVEATKSVFDRIRKMEGEIKAYVTLR